jgi:pyruvate dehydrogenase E2 component (dihydrolipoamide acetyltransferase)
MDETYTVKTLSPMRKMIAARMTEAKRTIPHFRLTAEIEVDALLEARKSLSQLHPGSKPSLNDFLIKACAVALIDTPAINVQWAEGEVRQYHTADISVVTALDDGLSTPIIRRADTKSIWEISCEVKELASRAAKNTLKASEIFGGSFTLSNLGMHGVDQFDAIINLPQCAILAVGAAKPRVVVGASSQMRVATTVLVTLSVDHRVVDGAIGAAFLSALRNRIEQPRSLLPV